MDGAGPLRHARRTGIHPLAGARTAARTCGALPDARRSCGGRGPEQPLFHTARRLEPRGRPLHGPLHRSVRMGQPPSAAACGPRLGRLRGAGQRTGGGPQQQRQRTRRIQPHAAGARRGQHARNRTAATLGHGGARKLAGIACARRRCTSATCWSRTAAPGPRTIF